MAQEVGSVSVLEVVSERALLPAPWHAPDLRPAVHRRVLPPVEPCQLPALTQPELWGFLSYLGAAFLASHENLLKLFC